MLDSSTLDICRVLKALQIVLELILSTLYIFASIFVLICTIPVQLKTKFVTEFD